MLAKRLAVLSALLFCCGMVVWTACGPATLPPTSPIPGAPRYGTIAQPVFGNDIPLNVKQAILTTVAPPWTTMAQDATVAVPPATQMAYAYDTTGDAAGTVVFPSSTDSVDQQLVSVHGISRNTTGALVVQQGTGTLLEDPNNPGNLDAGEAGTYTLTDAAGWTRTWIYQSTGARWMLRAQ